MVVFELSPNKKRTVKDRISLLEEFVVSAIFTYAIIDWLADNPGSGFFNILLLGLLFLSATILILTYLNIITMVGDNYGKYLRETYIERFINRILSFVNTYKKPISAVVVLLIGFILIYLALVVLERPWQDIIFAIIIEIIIIIAVNFSKIKNWLENQLSGFKPKS